MILQYGWELNDSPDLGSKEIVLIFRNASIILIYINVLSVHVMYYIVRLVGYVFILPLTFSLIACPEGTYKNSTTPGGKTTCIPCPDPSHVSPIGSTSRDQCKCKKGYHKIGERECAGDLPHYSRQRRSSRGYPYNKSNQSENTSPI